MNNVMIIQLVWPVIIERPTARRSSTVLMPVRAQILIS